MEQNIDHSQIKPTDDNSGAHMPNPESTRKISKEEIIDQHDLTFDPGDTLNGSLYICERLDSPNALSKAELLENMRTAEIWSQELEKTVPDEHREAYKEQLEIKEVIEYSTKEGKFSIACFDHPKYPSNYLRWSNWKSFFDARYSRS